MSSSEKKLNWYKNVSWLTSYLINFTGYVVAVTVSQKQKTFAA